MFMLVLVRPVVLISSSKLSSACQETAIYRSIVYWWTIAYAQQVRKRIHLQLSELDHAMFSLHFRIIPKQ